MGKRTHGSIINMMTQISKDIDLTKQAAANLDLASDAKSKHPSSREDDGTIPATEGARSAENEADVPKTAPGTSINEAAAQNPENGSENFADSQGTQSMDADESAAGNVDTPKKDHSKSMSDKGPGDQTFDGNYDKAAADIMGEANAVLAELAALNATEKPAAAKSANANKPEAGDDKQASEAVEFYKTAAETYPEDEAAGYAAAGMLMDYLTQDEMAKQAEDAQYVQAVEELTKQASNDAELLVAAMQGYQEKLAEGYGDEMPEGMPGGEMLGGEEGAGAMLPPELMGGGGAEMAGENGGGDLSDEETIEALAEALDEAGVTPEELAEAVSGAEGGEAEMANGEGADVAPEAMEVAASARGTGQRKAARVARNQSIRELVRQALSR
jgi:hypothetical protein